MQYISNPSLNGFFARYFLLLIYDPVVEDEAKQLICSYCHTKQQLKIISDNTHNFCYPLASTLLSMGHGELMVGQ
jgi:hypothetical protein